MNYTQYFKKCKTKYEDEMKLDSHPKLDTFYEDTVQRAPTETFLDWEDNIYKIKAEVKTWFDDNPDNVFAKYPNIFDFKEELDGIAGQLVPWLERNIYGCYLYVDKIYIYRTAPVDERVSSYVWHYDNNPYEIVKSIIYLTDVIDDGHSPFDYLIDGVDGKGVIFPGEISDRPIRTGEGQWDNDGSRVNEEVEFMIENYNYKSNKIYGGVGTTTIFNCDTIHRTNPVKSGYRDVVNIRVKPTLNPAPAYIGENYTTSFESNGIVNINPELAWTELI